MKLGPITLDHPFILAPMAGMTSSPYRRLMRRRGASLVVSELVSANGLHYAGAKSRELLSYHEEERPIGLQIFGEDTGRLCKAAQLIESLGADFVDLNMGCPVPKVVKKGAGSAMCRDTVQLGVILSELVRSVKIPVSIKIRSGWDENSKNAVEVARVAADCGIAFVAVHGRTRAAGYSGLADWEYIGTVKAKSSIPVIGNGDITTAEIGVERLRTFGVDAVMIGRAALRNPFLFEQCYAAWSGTAYIPPKQEDYLKLVDEMTVLFPEYYSDRGAMLHARKFLAWFSSGFAGASEFRRKVFTQTDAATLWSDARVFFAENSKIDDRFQSEPFLMGGHG
ncbi:MAG: tRNA dihydrouridine synthase DusB [Bdellovibrionales bacterium GWC1_52_8]|nr:MAG: tRNA dihydrouridine synthase DusB [Bdellovibrionales bacterium GWB1_52_6]OFZ02577.1 MAG: tRNA dihydrouridine synthase DusB [Bdellovibrionales bacterium GWA1_52_35]OFZ39482.1 MAG: tRNA dihydrouridine synthase DusB [Bdellovibrionales bacterium GWC1_52_8]HCM41429.1 tRNA dihydrouridine synthase DusB [Bdellovibrionales bacterium]